MARHVELVVNLASGSRLALDLAEKHIVPLIRASFDSHSTQVRQTEREGDGVRIGQEIISDHLKTPASSAPNGETTLDIVVVGGDGTTHELLNGLYIPTSDSREKVGGLKIRLAIVPGGTANALYAAMYPQLWTQEVQHEAATAKSIDELSKDTLEIMLKSVHALTSSTASKEEAPRLHVLPLMLNQLTTTTEEKEREKLSISHLVTSHALHASILHDADTPEMRAKHSGIERFKVAAQQNATRWTHGLLTLHPRSGGVLRYDPKSKAFKPFSADSAEVKGPFLYLNAMTTDRLESAFIPAPLSSAFAQDGLPLDAIDLVLIRPKQDPTLSTEENEEKAEVTFATKRLGDITSGMYSGGKHVDLVYDDDLVMVEYFRSAGYRFKPEIGKYGVEGEGDKGRLVCTDGYITKANLVEVRRWTGEEGDSRRVRQLDPPLVWR